MIKLSELIAPSFKKTFLNTKYDQIDKGGRGSTKTSKNALKVAYHCISEKSCSAIIIRKYQNTLANSVYKEIKRALKRLGLSEGIHYTSTVQPLRVKLWNGNNIYFGGGDDYEKLKGFIDENTPIKIVWFEELTEFKNEEELEQIIATFSRGNDDWFISLYSYNPPKNKYNWVNEWCERMKQRDDFIITESDYRTVPKEWLGKKFLDKAESLAKYDNKRYRWIYLGEVIGMEGMIYNPEQIEWVDENYLTDNNIRPIFIDISVDGGHQTSATTGIAMCLGSDGYFYLLDIYYYSPHEKAVKKAPSQLTQDIIDFEMNVCKRYNAQLDRETIDSAEGALRNQIYADYGKRFNPVNKGKDKEELVDYSSSFLSYGRFRALKNNNNKIFKREIENYKWVEGSVEKGKPIPNKEENRFTEGEEYYNSHAKDISYFYADHSVDAFQYWVKDNLQKLGLKE